MLYSSARVISFHLYYWHHFPALLGDVYQVKNDDECEKGDVLWSVPLFCTNLSDIGWVLSFWLFYAWQRLIRALAKDFL